ncbi:Crp/Fnr family transcriptional regulator [Chitinophaga filiformis]|uniref:cAMP-binding domain of CRP or a regulatory subunit of cAMP-dependent protein kinases n=1 Tax=Chitinophaga filiformis TaxID=104663 RepID=A0A1G7JI92_CHIFI|nr:Crp/Fnr family transcriptional regulator [Chitinophaga filiformis]SDF24640.1 cAMP-binding domain of CRP or a regulatory subunit of cAMP-dependent protein kinases [Chitinophaga filiformis]
MNTRKQPAKEDLIPLWQLLNSFHPVGKGIEQHLLKSIYCCSIPKGKYLLRNGEISHSLYFIRKGLLRGFIKEENKEITTWFAMENEMASGIRSFLLQIETVENIQAVEDCELLAISFSDLNKIYEKYPSFNITGRKITEFHYTSAENRAYITRLHDAEKKYALFLEFYPQFANRIQLTYVASFLGITIETLSRVRSKTSARKRST